MPRILAPLFFAGLVIGAAVWFLNRGPNPALTQQALPHEPDAGTPGKRLPGAGLAREESKGALFSARVPSATRESDLVELEVESRGRWIVKKRADGSAAKMSEGAFHPGGANPEASARVFLARFGRQVFGIAPSSIGPVEVVREAGSAQVTFSLELNGLPVYGAQHKQVFDAEGNIIYVVSDSLPDTAPSPDPRISREQAAAAAREGLLFYLGSAERARNEAAYPLGLFLNQGRLMYRLTNGSLSLVYRYEFPLSAPAYGDMEATIDAKLGAIVALQNVTRK